MNIIFGTFYLCSYIYRADEIYSCLKHIINLATQAVLRTYRQSKYFDPKAPDADLHMAMDGKSRDLVGIVRTIIVKVWRVFSQCIDSFLIAALRNAPL